MIINGKDYNKAYIGTAEYPRGFKGSTQYWGDTPPPPIPFTILVDTDQFYNGSVTPSPPDTFRLPIRGSNMIIDWGDGTVETGVTQTATPSSDNWKTHVYAAPGQYQIKITRLDRIYFNGTGDMMKLLEIQQWGTAQWATMQGAFHACLNMTMDTTDAPDLSNVTDMSLMFKSGISGNPDISQWDTSNVTDMSSMFEGAAFFNGDISTWNTGNVTNMHKMFRWAQSFNPVSLPWNTSKVTDMSSMFENATFFNPDSLPWNTWQVTNMRSMFYDAINFNPVSLPWNTIKVTDMRTMFYGATNFNSDISQWNTRNVTLMNSMFYGATNFNSDISGWDTGEVRNMTEMFRGAAAFNSDISGWDVSSIIDRFAMTSMFEDATSYNQNLSSMCVTNIKLAPPWFDLGATAWTLPRPVWGTCP